MKITIESTDKCVELRGPDGTMVARIWEGQTESGIPIYAYVTRIAVEQTENQTEFERELQSHRAPSPEVGAIPLRLLL